MRKLRIATRRSHLAITQSQWVADAIAALPSQPVVELATMRTRGDEHRGPLVGAGGKGLFTRELEAALRGREVQLAVHSAKDMPAEMEADFRIVAVPKREDPRDALAGRCGELASLPVGAVVGTGSLRRRAQLLDARDDLDVVAVRGNVETRLGKALSAEGEMAATVLAMAGLIRSGLIDEHAELIHPLAAESFVPAAAQGILAVQALAADEQLAELLAPLDDPASRDALEAERFVLRGLRADCHTCLAVHVAPASDGWRGRAMVARPNGSDMIRLAESGPSAAEVAGTLLDSLLSRGARELLFGS